LLRKSGSNSGEEDACQAKPGKNRKDDHRLKSLTGKMPP
jgi:hypothetical protein